MLSRTVIAFILLAAPVISSAQSLGIHGNVYEIQEEDAVDYLKGRIAGWQKDGTVKRKQEEAKKRVLQSMLHPKPIAGISTATKDRVFMWDPTFVLDKNVTDGKGHILFPAGTTINPLQYGGLGKRLVFIDARDRRQVEYAIKNNGSYTNDKIILTGRSWVELSKKLNKQVFYDQSGYLTHRFGIMHVPAIVSQDGLKLKIEEKAL